MEDKVVKICVFRAPSKSPFERNASCDSFLSASPVKNHFLRHSRHLMPGPYNFSPRLALRRHIPAVAAPNVALQERAIGLALPAPNRELKVHPFARPIDRQPFHLVLLLLPILPLQRYRGLSATTSTVCTVRWGDPHFMNGYLKPFDVAVRQWGSEADAGAA
ncbi:hypothetical protein BDU57DRAFT_525080 [Ampelomyces quisqualis]|uniref:Uncharacterized protein n=1 Tax=Ampelomyces quisqualis TaxID=50730 RepID=A0A6A5Q5P8_AMPQU|nr:hypothetical protein BDU57DRAFT_525080 [Ampelomyces quisqualis]